MTKRRIGKIFEYAVTFIMLLLGIVPGVFSIPSTLHPWFFLGAVMWIVVFSSGVLS